MKVDYNEVQRQKNELTVQTHQFPGTTVTIAIALAPDNYMLGIGMSACVDPSEMDPAIGIEVATENALKDAEEKIWQLEGAKLREKLKSA